VGWETCGSCGQRTLDTNPEISIDRMNHPTVQFTEWILPEIVAHVGPVDGQFIEIH
jgi:hypothetical protein